MNSNSWCVKCAKYLAFGTFETADDSALRAPAADVLNVPNVKFLAHLAPQTQK